MKQVGAINGDSGDDLSNTVSFLVESRDGSFAQRDPAVHDGEPGLPVPDSDLVGIVGGEKEANGEGERGGGAAAGVHGGWIGGRIGCDAHVLNANLLQIKLGLFRFDGEKDDEYDGDD